MKNPFPRRWAPFLAFGLLAACSSAPPYAAYAIEDDAELGNHVVVADKALRDVIRVGHPLVERVPGDNLRVVVPIRNIDDDPVQVLAQLDFRDRQQRPLGDSTNRQVMTIPPGMTVNFECISVRSDAMDYILRIGWNK